MGLSQALNTGVSGLMAHQKALDNIGNNLANVNTTGYKKGVYQFSTLLEQTLRGGMSASGNTGSINPIALGMGTQTGSINKVFTQGTLETTGSATDMAIWGNGFFVVSVGDGYGLTRDGSFYVSEDGYLMSGNGLYVQGTQATKGSDGSVGIPQDAKLENLSIPLNTTGGMSKTSEVSFAGNINSAVSVTQGLKLFGSNAPTVNDLQSWMDSDFNSKDTTWTALEESTYALSESMINYVKQNYPGVNVDGLDLGSNVSTYSGGFEYGSAYYAINTATGQVEEVYGLDADGNKVPVLVDDLLGGNYSTAIGTGGIAYIPVTQEISTINGGNVQTSAALGIKVPEYLRAGDTVEHNGQSYTVQNDYTYPAWFYESNGGNFAAAAATTNNPPAAADLQAAWPNGFQGEGALSATATYLDLPQEDETYAATLDTPLEHLYYYSGNKWTQLFANIKDGDEVTISFDKGSSAVTGTFVYNVPGTPQPFGDQQKLDIEQSYTLEHLLKFMAGDVNDIGSACAAITPAMFGAPVTAEYPDGDPYAASFDKRAYEEALANYDLAKSDANTNTQNTGIMGLVDVGANISAENGGDDPYDSPMETPGAFTREGVSQVDYTRYNAVTGKYETVKADSFNISFVSNLGAENALSNITLSYNNVTSKAVFSAETEYAATDAKSGSATATVTYYDSLGNAKTATLRMSLVEQDTNFSTWRWYADSTDDTDFPWQVDPETGEIISSLNVGTGLFRFDSDGNFVGGSDYSETGGIVINLANQGVDDPISVSIINGLNGEQKLDFSGLTFSATDNDLSLESQNGAPPGTLNEFQVASDGTIYGVYSTGQVLPLGRLVVATVTNQNGLSAGGDNLYYVTPASGDPQYGYASLGGRGDIRQYQLETSNVDLSEEFTKMISIERGYQANSRIITTADEMLQELLSMVR